MVWTRKSALPFTHGDLRGYDFDNGSRMFAELWNTCSVDELKSYAGKLRNLRLLPTSNDHTDALLSFEYRGFEFFVVSSQGEYLFYVCDSSAPDSVLLAVATHFNKRLRQVTTGIRYIFFENQFAFGLRYLLACVALIALCLAFATLPKPIDGGGSGVSYSHIIDLRPCGFYAAASIFMHLFCSGLRMNSFSRWFVSILVPSLAMLVLHFWWVAKIEREKFHYPISISPTEVFVFNLVAFAISFAIVSWGLKLVEKVTQPKNRNLTNEG